MKQVFISILMLWCSSALAAECVLDTSQLRPGPSGVVSSIVDGDTLFLEDGRQIRLVGIQAPKLPLGRKGFQAWPLAEPSRQALEDLVKGQQMAVWFGTAPEDRWGRALAHLVRQDGLWVQGEMLTQGMARVYSFADNRLMVGQMLACEQTARAADQGMWRLRTYRIRTPDELRDQEDRFHLVEGQVLAAANVRGTIYLNFGPDWREDFTIQISGKVRRMFEKQGLDPSSWSGARVRTRGWVEDYNGALIKISHPEQLELIEERGE